MDSRSGQPYLRKKFKTNFFFGWIGEYENQPVFIFVKYLTNFAYVDTEKLIEIEDHSYYLSLFNGGTIDGNTDRFYLSGGEELDDLLPYNLQQIAYFEELPERIQTLYDECYKKLIEFEEQN